MTEETLVCIGGPCAGQRLKRHSRHRFVTIPLDEGYSWIDRITGERVMAAISAVTYKREILACGDKQFAVLVPIDSLPMEWMQELIDGYGVKKP